MARYCLTCDACGKELDAVCQWEQLAGNTPECCGATMRRDYTREHFGGVSNPGKGVYPLRDMDDAGNDIIHDSPQSHQRWMKEHGLFQQEKSREWAYKNKHARDLPPRGAGR